MPVPTAELGIGALAAAAGASVALARTPTSSLVLLGTCGAYPGSGLAIGDVVVVTTSRLVDAAVVRGEATALGAWELSTDLELVARFAPIGRKVTCATTLALTTSDALATELAATGVEVEHLEVHGVAVACAGARVPFVAVLGVANAVGAAGRAEWSANHRGVEDRLGELVAGLVCGN